MSSGARTAISSAAEWARAAAVPTVMSLWLWAISSLMDKPDAKRQLASGELGTGCGDGRGQIANDRPVIPKSTFPQFPQREKKEAKKRETAATTIYYLCLR